MSKSPLKVRELKKKLKAYGVIEMPSRRGKGSERILLLPSEPGSTKGPQYPIKDHGPGTEISWQVIDSILDRFNISPDDFWD